MGLEPGTLVVAARSEAADPLFGRTVVLIVDHEPNGIVTGLVLNRRLQDTVAETSALALLFVPDPSATVFWGGPMGDDPAILAELTDTEGLEWFHLAKLQSRPFPLPNVGLIALAEHPDPFEGRIRRARLYVGLCVWGAGQLEAELADGAWHTAPGTLEAIFCSDPERLWGKLST